LDLIESISKKEDVFDRIIYEVDNNEESKDNINEKKEEVSDFKENLNQNKLDTNEEGSNSNENIEKIIKKEEITQTSSTVEENIKDVLEQVLLHESDMVESKLSIEKQRKM
jgi:translation initiation factor IF-2